MKTPRLRVPRRLGRFQWVRLYDMAVTSWRVYDAYQPYAGGELIDRWSCDPDNPNEVFSERGGPSPASGQRFAGIDETCGTTRDIHTGFRVARTLLNAAGRHRARPRACPRRLASSAIAGWWRTS